MKRIKNHNILIQSMVLYKESLLNFASKLSAINILSKSSIIQLYPSRKELLQWIFWATFTTRVSFTLVSKDTMKQSSNLNSFLATQLISSTKSRLRATKSWSYWLLFRSERARFLLQTRWLPFIPSSPRVLIQSLSIASSKVSPLIFRWLRLFQPEKNH